MQARRQREAVEAIVGNGRWIKYGYQLDEDGELNRWAEELPAPE